MATIEFQEWLQAELDNRNWKQADLSRASGLSTAAISRIMTGSRGVGTESCKAIAHAFQLPQEIIFRKARFLTAKPKNDPLNDLILFLANQLQEEEKEDLVEYIRLRIERANGRVKRGVSKKVARIAE